MEIRTYLSESLALPYPRLRIGASAVDRPYWNIRVQIFVFSTVCQVLCRVDSQQRTSATGKVKFERQSTFRLSGGILLLIRSSEGVGGGKRRRDPKTAVLLRVEVEVGEEEPGSDSTFRGDKLMKLIECIATYQVLHWYELLKGTRKSVEKLLIKLWKSGRQLQSRNIQ